MTLRPVWSGRRTNGRTNKRYELRTDVAKWEKTSRRNDDPSVSYQDKTLSLSLLRSLL